MRSAQRIFERHPGIFNANPADEHEDPGQLVASSTGRRIVGHMGAIEISLIPIGDYTVETLQGLPDNAQIFEHFNADYFMVWVVQGDSKSIVDLAPLDVDLDEIGGAS
jgi:hypothetical protein